MLASFAFVAVLAAVANVNADHRITLRNNCGFGVGLTLSNYPHNGVDYTGPAIGDIGAKSSKVITVPTRWNGRICDRPPNSGCQNDCFGGIAFGEAPCSMTEWNFDAPSIGGKTDYDISNIQGYSVAQQIIPDSGDTVTCTSAGCPCNQAYRPGDTSGTCGGTGPVDQATRVSGGSGFTVVYCP
ncbi:COP8 protein [Favolaschia claudopus]|uniref:COP8 protein n=1 Tax=Favolaschia claudopus TaxID=2862362 RepID=A0AAW0CJP4_9AGAR